MYTVWNISTPACGEHVFHGSNKVPPSGERQQPGFYFYRNQAKQLANSIFYSVVFTDVIELQLLGL